MREELDIKLCEDFPRLFRDRNKSVSETAMCWGFQCGDGWFDLLYNLCFILNMLDEKYNLNIAVSTVKEKFGTLRFYYIILGPEDDDDFFDENVYENACGAVSQVIQMAEVASYHTCEECGHWSDGPKGKGWMYNRCETCTKKLNVEKA